MKVVDLVTRNSDQFSLHFYDFSTNLYRFYKFTTLEKPKRKRTFCAEAPGRSVFLADMPLAGLWSRGPAAAGFPACLLTGGEGDVGEKGEGVEAHHWVPGIGVGAT